MLMVQGSMRPEAFPEAEASLQRAVELNPDFAPAYATLAFFYSLRPETLEKALAAARKATALEPGNARYELNVAQALRRLERFEEARAVAQRVLATAQSDEIRTSAQSFLQELSRYQEYAAQRKRYEEEARASRERLQSDARAEPAARPVTSSETVPGPAATGKARLYSATGKITEVHCTVPTEMDLTLSVGAIVMHLHAANYFKVDYETTSWKPPKDFNPCVHLKGLSAQLSYRLLHGKSYDGEIVSIEVRK
jgi:tetratricopeptide (TPR) repeat protein